MPLRETLERLRVRRLPGGAVAEPLSAEARAARLADLGEPGRRGTELAGAARAAAGRLAGLSPVSTPVATRYAERIVRPLPALDAFAATELILVGYAGHRLVEAEPDRFGVGDIPVLGTLPARPPADLANRVLRATRKDFPQLCALEPGAWEGFVAETVGLVQAAPARPRPRRGSDWDLPGVVAPEVVEGLLRFGWILRQVDLHYGRDPVEATPPPGAPRGRRRRR